MWEMFFTWEREGLHKDKNGAGIITTVKKRDDSPVGINFLRNIFDSFHGISSLLCDFNGFVSAFT